MQKKTKVSDQKTLSVDVDGNWKALIHMEFRGFVKRMMPKLYPKIDWKKGYEPLEQELLNFIKKTKKGARTVDKLYKVWLKNGEEQWILIHIEVQHAPDPNINERMHQYFMFIYLKYNVPVEGFVLFTGETMPPNVGISTIGVSETVATYKFSVFHVQQLGLNNLVEEGDLFSLAILANQIMLQTTDNDPIRLEWKKKITLLGEKLGDKFKIIVNFVAGILLLQPNWEEEYINFFKNNLKMGKYKEPKFTGAKHVLDIAFSVEYDMTFTEYDRRVKSDRRKLVRMEADQERLKAEKEGIKEEKKGIKEEKKGIKEEKKGIKEEKKQIALEKRRVEEEKKRAEVEKQRQFEVSIMRLRYGQNMEIQDIADCFEIDIPTIEAVLKKYEAQKAQFFKKK